ncbi:MAG: epoxyqueuosine reductase QueH, partial [Clostridia bacterium]|nr:epoxyqueuosine reductase QueH [Clostridia bacterium]
MDTENSLDIKDCDYDNDLYENLIKGLEKEPERGNRCNVCYLMR